MRYFKRDGNEYLENGPSLVRVGEVLKKPSPIFKDRTLRVLEVLEVKRHGKTPIERGFHLAISFPNSHINSPSYVWYASGKWEECMVPLTFAGTPKPIERELKHFGKKSPHE